MLPFRTLAATGLLLSAQTFAQVQTRYGFSIDFDQQDTVQRFDGIWSKVAGSLVNVSIANDNTVWGVNRPDGVFRWLGGDNWVQMPGALVQISVGSEREIWGVRPPDARQDALVPPSHLHQMVGTNPGSALQN